MEQEIMEQMEQKEHSMAILVLEKHMFWVGCTPLVHVVQGQSEARL